MGSGKSAVGRRLATELNLRFIDSDLELEERTGVDIPYIFDKEGEAGFRQREAQLIQELVELDGIVLATGGGTPQDEGSRRLLASHGTVVYLYTSVAEQQRRTRKSRDRPLLNEGDPAEVLERLMEIRDPQYREIADLTVDTDGRHVHAVTRELMALLDGKDAGSASDQN